MPSRKMVPRGGEVGDISRQKNKKSDWLRYELNENKNGRHTKFFSRCAVDKRLDKY